MPARGQRPRVNTRGVMLQCLWPRHIDRQHYDGLLLPGRFQHRTSRTGGAATTCFRWLDGCLDLIVAGWCQCAQVRTSNAIPTHPIAQRPTADPQEARRLYYIASGLAERLAYPY